MNQQPTPMRVVSPKVRMLRLALFFMPLLLVSSYSWLGLAIDARTLFALIVILPLVGLLTFIDRSVNLWHRKNLAIVIGLIILPVSIAVHYVWREGRIVAQARFNPGIAPFDITVREVPVPVTKSHHFIVTLRRGQYPVTSFRFFWIAYTPTKVRIEWKRLETFNVVFDERYVSTCNWTWGSEAAWTMQVPPGAEAPGDKP